MILLSDLFGLLPAACMNAVRNPNGGWYRCEWIGDIESLDDECPRCFNKGRMAPVVDVKAEAEK